MNNKSNFIPTTFFQQVNSISELPPKRFHLITIFEFIQKFPELSYSFYKSKFLIPTHNKQVYVYGIRKNDQIIYTTNGHSFGGFLNNITKEFLRYKNVTDHLLKDLKIPSPSFYVCKTLNGLQAYSDKCDFSKNTYVVKPCDGSKGQDVYLNIKSKQDLIKYGSLILDKKGKAQIELMLNHKQDIRIQTIGGKFYAAVHRMKANVIGDGISNIKTLVDLKNSTRQFKPIIIDDITSQILAEQNLNITSIPLKNQTVNLKNVCSFSQGGDVIDVTNNVNPQIIRQTEDICRYFQIENLGLDILTNDISKPLEETGGVILEINPQPHWDVIFAVKGYKIVEDILGYLF